MPARSDLPLLRTVALLVGLASLAFLLWWVRDGLLLAFGAVFVATLLRLVASWFQRLTSSSDGVGLALAILLVAAIIATTLWLFGLRVAADFEGLLERLRGADQSIRQMFQRSGIGGLAFDVENSLRSGLGKNLGTGLYNGTSILEGGLIMTVTAIYLAAQPQLYRNGVVALFTSRLRPVARETLDLMGLALRQWLIAELILMAFVGVVSSLGLWLIGLPNPIALGLIAGVAELIPYLGPFVGAIPALLVALTQSMQLALLTLAVYTLIHLLEGYVLSPLLQRRLLTVPPALTLIGIVIAQFIFGSFGVVFAAPITAMAFVVAKKFVAGDAELPSGNPLSSSPPSGEPNQAGPRDASARAGNAA